MVSVTFLYYCPVENQTVFDRKQLNPYPCHGREQDLPIYIFNSEHNENKLTTNEPYLFVCRIQDYRNTGIQDSSVNIFHNEDNESKLMPKEPNLCGDRKQDVIESRIQQ